MNGASRGGVVKRSGQLERALIRQWQQGLHRSFAKALGAHHHPTAHVLDGSGDDFTGAGAALVDQHHQGHLVKVKVADLGAELRALCCDSGFGADHYAAIDKGINHAHGSTQDATGVVTQIQHDALQWRLFIQRS